jgi:hypothetical protein
VNELELENKIKKLLEDAPSFGNSEFQIKAFALGQHNGHRSRTYRQALLDLNDKYRSLMHSKFNKKKQVINIKKKIREIELETDELNKEMLKVELEESKFLLSVDEKIIKDCIRDCTIFLEEIEKIKPVTSDEYEKEELEYWKTRLIQDAQLEVLQTGSIGKGTSKSLISIGVDPIRLQIDVNSHHKEIYKNLIEDKCQKNT